MPWRGAPMHDDEVMVNRLEVTRALKEAGCIAPREEADALIRAAAGDLDALAGMVARRVTGEPIAWLVGSVTFCGLTLAVTPGVYVPRQRTQVLARRAAGFLPPEGVAVDLCTGAGAVAAAMAAASPNARVVATELDHTAVRCARQNGVEVFEGFLDDPLPPVLEQRCDVLTAVVPYVPTDALRLLPRDVQAFEPRLALDGGVDGMDLMNEVVRRSLRWLRPGGRLLMELGGDQAGSMEERLHDTGFDAVDVMADEDGDPRAVSARLVATEPGQPDHTDAR